MINSTIDHCYVSSEHSFGRPKVQEVGDSDHLGVSVEKVIRVALSSPSTILKRVYKDFTPEAYCSHLAAISLKDLVFGETSLGEADRVHHRELLHTANLMALSSRLKSDRGMFQA